MVARNLMEDLVDMKVDHLMQMVDMCRCPKCRADVLALALNNLPPRYVVNICGDVYVRFEGLTEQGQAEITSAVVRAAEVVSKKPMHVQTVSVRHE